MANIAGFNAEQYGEMQNFDTMPAHKAVAMIVSSEMKATANGLGQRLVLTAEIMSETQYKGRKLWISLNLSNPNKTAEDIANRELATICKCLGVMHPQDSAELHNKPFIVDIGVRNKKDKDKKEIVPPVPENYQKGYEPVGGGLSAGPVAASAPPPITQATEPQTRPVNASPPWLKK